MVAGAAAEPQPQLHPPVEAVAVAEAAAAARWHRRRRHRSAGLRLSMRLGRLDDVHVVVPVQTQQAIRHVFEISRPRHLLHSLLLLDHPPLLDVHEEEVAYDRGDAEEGEARAHVQDGVLQVELAAAPLDGDDELHSTGK